MLFRLGVVLMAGSFVPWLLLPAVPLLPLSATEVAAVAVGLVVLAELVFWPGVLPAGHDARLAARARGWRRLPASMLEMLRTGAPPPHQRRAAGDA